MKRKKPLILLILAITCLIIYSKTQSLTQNNFKLIFNPKQITPISPLYCIKNVREYFQSIFIFGDEDSSYWHLTLAQKRINESRILLDHQLTKQSKKQLQLAQKNQQMAAEHLQQIINKIDTNYLQQKNNDILFQIKDLEKQY